MLYYAFMSDIAPITLHTDDSDYGVGGYLFQTVDGIDRSEERRVGKECRP